jgi:two-component system, chemotaxis family, response regulator Rcp1
MFLHESPRDIEILLVEDNPGDVDLTTELFAASKITNRISVVADGVEAMAFLRREGKYANAPAPDLMLLDLNLPRMDGRAVLEQIKNDPQLRTLPVVILTSSEAESDIARSYNLHANCYCTKPVRLEEFAKVIASIEDFWLKIVRLPARQGTSVGGSKG